MYSSTSGVVKGLKRAERSPGDNLTGTKSAECFQDGMGVHPARKILKICFKELISLVILRGSFHQLPIRNLRSSVLLLLKYLLGFCTFI